MEFFDNLVLPQSAEHIELLHYMLSLIQILFITFISIVFGGLIISLYFKNRGVKKSDTTYLNFAKDVIELVTVNNSVGLILGIVPLLTALLIFAQLLHTAEIAAVSYLALSFVFITAGLIMAYIFRHSFAFNRIFSNLNNADLNDKSFGSEVEKFKTSTSNLSVKNGRYAVVFLFIGIWLFTGATTSAANFKTMQLHGILSLLFSAKVLLNLSIFLFMAFTLTGSVLLFGYLYWKEDRVLSEDYKDFIKFKSSRIALYSALPLPLLIAANVYSIPASVLSGTVFFYAIAALLLIFLALHLIYMIQQYNKQSYSAPLFFIVIFALLALIVKDQVAMTNATASHSVILSTRFDEVLNELKGTGQIAEISGKEIYDVRCASCHQFDQKLVGPAHKDVLPKYEGKQGQLVAYIRNPVKVDPAFPPMPNPGLKPQEAEAVAKYLMETYQERKN